MKFIKFSSDGVIMFQQCSRMDQCLMDLKQDKNYDLAVGGFSRHLKHLPQFSATEIFCFDKSESLISYPISLIVKNERKAIIDTVIKRFLEFGIIQKIILDFRSMEEKDKIAEDVPIELRFEHVDGFFIFIYGIGMAISALIWLFELLVNMKSRNKKAHRTWHFIERCIDGRRHYFKNLPEKLRNKFSKEHQTQ